MNRFFLWFAFLVVFGPCFILQTVGLFSQDWLIKDSCDAVGLFYRCCTRNSTECFVDVIILNKEVLGLQAASFSLMFLAVISMCCMMQCGKGADDPGCLGATLLCSVVLYPVAGLFSIVGCIVLAAKYSISHLSWGFYLCIVAGCYILLLTIISCCILVTVARLGLLNDDEYETYGRSGKQIPLKIRILRLLYNYDSYDTI